MKQIFLSILLALMFSATYSQTAIKVMFQTQTVYKEELLKSMPVHIRAAALQQLNSIKKESFMTVQSNKVYFEIKSQKIDKKQSGAINSTDKSSNVLFAKDLSLSGSYPAVKLIKDFKTKTIVTKTKDKLTTEKLISVNWKFTNKQIKVLGYSCYEATTEFKNKLLTVYFTKDLKVSASPSNLPFIDGVVLAYKHGNSTTTALKVELQQPELTNFL